ncbi:MAG: glycosyltransferase [Vicinamibacteria bacterium]|nr:glycosyltransferase [Vicinamibacteria bacterium]
MTVAVPLFQKAAYVGRALESILGQTFRDFEVVVVDDGSTDGGPAAVDRVADPRVRLVRQPNAGVGAARNRAVHEARAPWIAFLDADDEWYPRFLERTLAEAKGGVHAVFTNLRTAAAAAPLLPDVPCDGRTVIDYFDVALRSGGVGLSSQATLVSKAALLAIGGFPQQVAVGEDADAWARLAWSGPIAYVPEVLAVYHNECSGRARNAPPIAPRVVQTWADWNEAGRVPAHLARSSHLYANWTLVQHAIDLIHAGRRREGLRVLRACRPLPFARRLWLTAWLRTPLPVAALETLRRVYHSLVPRHPASIA